MKGDMIIISNNEIQFRCTIINNLYYGINKVNNDLMTSKIEFTHKIFFSCF